MAMKNPTESVYELEDAQKPHVFEIMEEMKIIMVKGIGYVVVNRNMERPDLFRHMGEVVARTYEEKS